MSAPIPVKIKLLKEMHHVDVDLEAPVAAFRAAIEEKTYLSGLKIFQISS